MAKTELLKAIELKSAKPKEKKYYLNDGGGLRLCINSNGSKIWTYRFMLNGRSRETTFQSYPKTSLKEAREKRDQYKKLINDNIDPVEHFKKLKQKKKSDINGMYETTLKEWLKKEAEYTQEVTHSRKIRLFEKDVTPYVKNKHMRDITIDDIIEIIDRKKITAPETASRMFSYLNNLFRYAVLKRYCDRNLLQDIRKTDIIRPPQKKHYPKITDIEILKELVNAIYNYHGGYSLRNCLKLVLHLPLRADNLCKLKWDYIDFDKKILTIPRDEMKIKDINIEDYQVPLTDEVINILQDQKQEVTKYTDLKEFVFLGTDNIRHINKESPNRTLERLGFNDEKRGRRIRLHGFRGTFRSMIDTLDTDGKFTFEAKERILDHHEKNLVARAYSHKANYIEQMRELMSFWSEYIESLRV